jgi:ubiquitin carboxyl-terminal hydrolase 10
VRVGQPLLSQISQAGRMNNRHLPAGQTMPGGGAGAGGVDMASGPGGGPRRRMPASYVPQYHQHVNPAMYPNYMNPYASQYYPQMPPPYQNGGMPTGGYMHYPTYTRSPPSMQQFAPLAGVSVPTTAYQRPPQQSPNLQTPYQPPPAPAPVPPHTPSSTHSSQAIHAPVETPTPPARETPIPPQAAPAEPTPAPPTPTREPFRPPVSHYRVLHSSLMHALANPFIVALAI